jgi:hypothetical protein
MGMVCKTSFEGDLRQRGISLSELLFCEIHSTFPYILSGRAVKPTLELP